MHLPRLLLPPTYTCLACLSLGGMLGAQDGFIVQTYSPSPSTTTLAPFGPSSIATPGDVDGDGVVDVLSYSGTLTGAVLFSGATGAILWQKQLIGIDPNTLFGAGDLNADGTPDISVVTGSSATQLRALRGESGADIWSVPLAQYDAHVAGGVDISGDGTSDLVVGSPFANVVQFLSGVDGAQFNVLVGAPMSSFGFAVGLLDDIDADGVAEVAVGSPNHDALGLADCGLIRVHSGATGAALYSIYGSNPNQGLGYSLATIPDITSDGHRDIAVPMGNKIRVFSGKSGLIYKTASAGGFVIDSRLVEIGDFNGDGRTDLAMQIAPPAGFGGGLLLRVVDPAADVPLFSLGLGAGTHSIAPLNDLNGDGSSELVVSRPGNLDQLVAFSHVGVPAGSTSFGVGCQGSQSSLPTIRAVGGGPYSQGNSAFGVRLLGAIPGSPALLLTGASFLSWQGAPLPLDLGFLGMSGCSLYVAPDSIKAALVSSGPLLTGTATIALPVPADPALLDTVLNLQWFVFDAGTPLGVMSNAMQLLVL